MRAALVTNYGDPVQITEVDLAPPQDGEVLVRIEAAGVCHSDLSVVQGKLPYPLPCVIGHEGAGVVEEVGPGVRTVKPGDRVIVNWTPRCGQCYWCNRGQAHLCQTGHSTLGLMDDGTSRLSREGQMLFHGINAATLAERAVLREGNVIPIDDDVPFDIAAVVGCGVMTGVGAAINTARLEPGETAAVIGLGGVGMSVIQGARAAGAGRIIAIDPVNSKLEAAKRFGATDTINPTSTDVASAVLEATSGRGADVAFEAVGVPALQRQAFDITRRGGRTVMVGVTGLTDELTIPSMFMTLYEKSILGTFYGGGDPRSEIPRVLDMWRAGRLDLESMVTGRGKLDDVNAAFETMRSGESIRTVLTPG